MPESKADQIMAFSAVRWHPKWVLGVLITFTVFVVLLGNALLSLRSTFSYLHLRSDADLELVIVPQDVVSKYDAYCLDGSPPAFYIRRGTSLLNSWIIALAPGKFCWDPADCAIRAMTSDGTSRDLPTYIEFEEGLLAPDASRNPDFYDWNMVYVHYCDGGLFLGAKPVAEADDLDSNTQQKANTKAKAKRQGGQQQIYYRGYFVLLAVLHHLANAYRIFDARNVLFVGSQLTGLALPLTVDHMRLMFFSKLDPTSTIVSSAFSNDTMVTRGCNVKLVLDSTFIADRPNQHGRATLSEALAHMFATHRIGNTPIVMRTLTAAIQNAYAYSTVPSLSKHSKDGGLFKSSFERCVEENRDRDPSPSDLRINLPQEPNGGRASYSFKCLYLEHVSRFVETPIMVIQSPYDRTSREVVLQSDCDYMQHCEGDGNAYSVISDYRQELVTRLAKTVLLNRARHNAAFVPSCFFDSWLFDQILFEHLRVDRVSLRKLLVSWFHGRALLEGEHLFETYNLIDRIYPSNLDCYDLEIKRGMRRD